MLHWSNPRAAPRDVYGGRFDPPGVAFGGGAQVIRLPGVERPFPHVSGHVVHSVGRDLGGVYRTGVALNDSGGDPSVLERARAYWMPIKDRAAGHL